MTEYKYCPVDECELSRENYEEGGLPPLVGDKGVRSHVANTNDSAHQAARVNKAWRQS